MKKKNKDFQEVTNNLEETKVTKVEVTNSNDDFSYVQMDKNIHDKKFETKPTTFFKDALKRFVKNKSSVAAGAILGVLILLAIIVPIANTNDITKPVNEIGNLPPRWAMFEKSGILNGKISYKDVVYDNENKTPVGYEAGSIVGEVIKYEGELSTPHKLGRGGNIAIQIDKHDRFGGIESKNTVTFSKASDYDLNIVLDKHTAERDVLPEFAVIFHFADSTGADTEIFLRDYSSEGIVKGKDKIEYKIPFTKILRESALVPTAKEYLTGSFEVRINKVPSGTYPTVYLKSFIITSANETEPNSIFENINITDANKTMLDVSWNNSLSRNPDIEFSCLLNLYNAIIDRCSFTYDPYNEVFGIKQKTMSKLDLLSYVDKGYCTIDLTLPDDEIKGSFKILDEKKCPIISLDKVVVKHYGEDTSYNFETTILRYKLLGYESIPYFIFGTNNNGYDFFKIVFAGLRTSLILGFACALVNILIGICWGAISGYFGGWTDLIMERITDILGGVPRIVVMTLCILHLGNNFFVFFLALCLTGWIGTSASTRSQIYRYKGREYVLASRTLGAHDARLIFRHILPNAIGPIVTSGVLMIPGIIFQEATISYLGLGLKGLDSLGVALSDAQKLITSQPYLIICASIVVSILMICFNLFGNGLRDAFNPSLKGAE
ncbi:MAG: ABC transporter permease [Bacilli bacterium]